MGDSFIVDPIGQFVCEAGVLTETILFHAIPRVELRTSPTADSRTTRMIAEALAAEYWKLSPAN